MKTYVIRFSDLNGVLDTVTMKIHASSFPVAYAKAVDFQSHFANLVLTSITMVL